MKRKGMVYCLILIVFLFPASAIGVHADEFPPAAFSISILRPNGDCTTLWPMLLEHTLPQIGIGIDFHSSTNWDAIALRTWEYPLIDFDYIPTYDQGGYDILCRGYAWDLDWDPTGVFDTSSLIPTGKNYYQYVNPLYDILLTNYLTELDQIERVNYAKQMQAILYEDLPSIAVLYERALYGFKEGLEGIDGTLLNVAADRYEYWDDPSDHVIKIGIPWNLDEHNSFIKDTGYNDYFQYAYLDNIWMQGIFGTLYQREQKTQFWKPQIASNMTISEDYKNYTIEIDPNAKFSDGSPVLAEDVEFSYELHMTPAVGSSYYSYLMPWLASNDSVSATSSDSVTFNLTDTHAFVHNLLSFGIIDKSVVQPAISTYGYGIFNEVPLTGNVSDILIKSCGPFKLDEFNQTASSVKLIPNPYYGDLVNCNSSLLEEFHVMHISGKDTAVANLIAGNIDIVDAYYYPRVEDLTPAGVEGILVKVPKHLEISINMRHPVFGTGELTPLGTPEGAKYVRKAISHAVPRAVICEEIKDGLATLATNPCPDAASVYDDNLEPHAFDIELARDYMNFAGIPFSYPTSATTTDTPTTTIGSNLLISITLLVLIGLTATQSFKRKITSSD
ncbi:MAG: hypothetical protein GOP50_04630 [Candidatus Heimdallarchaeota archaeon]|nr:hypothetical protein [Candidatus Heimdallarchaeota archaeon]